ncbi:MAG: MarR family transcriptional regulator [Bacteroidota bacterium]|nr:MarR family transcriptional regulator [Bacteroidota bacterium]MDP4214637.1 MarR family transcriptional regulator [Bacteroidota bacterium]MDP4244706.1 MarR family transcriptional regulator [Bacteroidota bacterium]MDP4253449.1 MarR family transcriptional regulator [Bacteroidota bacterium]MDP4258953.1 MarR family transcriptional regulator [Bacteroidota bacterium]
MTLEKDINQTKFRNEHQKATVNIIYTNNWIMERISKIFDAAGITSQQYNILRILRGAGKPLSTSQIRQRMLDKMSDSSRIVDRLVLKGMVKKNDCKSDKRLVDIVITSKGLKLLEKIDAYNGRVDSIMMNLSETEAKALNKLLDKIRDPDLF